MLLIGWMSRSLSLDRIQSLCINFELYMLNKVFQIQIQIQIQEEGSNFVVFYKDLDLRTKYLHL